VTDHSLPASSCCLPAVPMVLPMVLPELLLLMWQCHRNVTLAPVTLGLDLPPWYQSLLGPYTQHRVGAMRKGGGGKAHVCCVRQVILLLFSCCWSFSQKTLLWPIEARAITFPCLPTVLVPAAPVAVGAELS
jgi:hypothetical protein